MLNYYDIKFLTSNVYVGIFLFVSRRLKKPRHPEIYYGKTGVDLPVLHLGCLNSTLVASYSGPDGGLTRVN